MSEFWVGLGEGWAKDTSVEHTQLIAGSEPGLELGLIGLI